MITLRQLRYLAAVSETRHFGQAATLCHVTQPALSMQIQELEQDLGLQLVERRRNSIALTADGEEVVRRASSILASVSDLQDYARRKRPALTGLLRLGIIPSIAPYLLPKALPELHKHFPELELRLRETQTKSLVDELVRGDLDLIVIALPVDHPELETLRVFEDRFFVAQQACSATRAKKRMSVADLSSQRLLLLEEGHCLRDQVLSVCARSASTLDTTFGASSLSTVMHLVANGYGITLLPEMAAETEANDARIHLVPFCDPEPTRTIGLAWRKSSARRADAEALSQILSGIRATP
ncbi:LysR substrate-binding domain-containing protein [Microvirga sp. 2MCAF38]|uniref:hydrogen peroxide-inducible genes activator n=1 Tax=Microvirga sp. 2MCAF38 TaxID=3232989 RepID=UPI003F953DE4